MESIKRKDDLELYYKLCIRELESAKTNIKTCLSKVDELFLWICDILNKYSRNSQAYLTVYDAVATDLSNLAEITRKFNISCESNSLKFNCISEKLNNYEKGQFTYIKPDLLKYGTNYTGDCVITYIKDKDQKLFYISECENPEQQKCAAFLKNYFLGSPKRYNDLPKEGEVFGIFIEGYLLRAVRENDQYFGNSIGYSYNAYLIDIGETIKITTEMELYFLPYECTQIPALAILCKLEMVDSSALNLDKFLNDKIYVKFKFVVLSQDDFVLHVNLVRKQNPFLDYMDNNSACGHDFQPVLINPFRQYQCIFKKKIIIENNDDKNIFVANTNNTQLLNTTFLNGTITNNCNNNFIEQVITPKNIHFNSGNCTNNIQNAVIPVISGIDSNNCMTTLKQNNLNLSQELYTRINDSNNSNTSDLTDNLILRNQKSNQSEISKQMKRLSLHDYYNDIINNSNTKDGLNLELSNFNMNQQNNDTSKEQIFDTNKKQLNESILPLTTQQQQHGIVELQNNENNEIPIINHNSSYDNNLQQKTLEDGSENKKSKIFRNIKTKLVYPKVGEVVTIIPTCIQTTEIFFAHYYNHESRYGPTLGELIRKMNEPEQIKMYTPIKRPLEKFELVLALFKDGFWYRARVVNIYDNLNVKVFYVDYGNADLVTINQIRSWEPRYDNLPFQAIQCQISGIKEKPFSVTILESIKKMILDKYLRAKIINKIDNKVLVVKISDSEGCDIGDQLILMGFCDKK